MKRKAIEIVRRSVSEEHYQVLYMITPLQSSTFNSLKTLGGINSEKAAEPKEAWKDYILIRLDSRWKGPFDVLVIFLMAYSCFTSIYLY